MRQLHKYSTEGKDQNNLNGVAVGDELWVERNNEIMKVQPWTTFSCRGNADSLCEMDVFNSLDIHIGLVTQLVEVKRCVRAETEREHCC